VGHSALNVCRPEREPPVGGFDDHMGIGPLFRKNTVAQASH